MSSDVFYNLIGKRLKSIWEYETDYIDILTEEDRFHIKLDSQYVCFTKEDRKDALYYFIDQEIKQVIYNPCLFVSKDYGARSSLCFVFSEQNHSTEESLISFSVEYINDNCSEPKVTRLEKDH